MTLALGTVGILPPGALGMAFYYHLTQQLTQLEGVYFLERRGSASAQALKSSGALQIQTAQGIQVIPTQGVLQPDLIHCYEAGWVPEVILVCPNPDQVLSFISTTVYLLETIYAQGALEALPLPILVLSANGIYFQRVRQLFIEKLEEATLFGRLPDLWPELMPRIVGRLVRGVTVQTGVREGAGRETVYYPGPRGRTRLAGGDSASRGRAGALLQELGGWFEEAPHSSATRLEFDKALINLACNVLGQIYAIDEHGQFNPLIVDQIITPERYGEIRELVYRVLQVGQAVRAYGPQEDLEAMFQELLRSCQIHGGHIPSSLQWIAMKIRLGTLEPEITPTEAWLIDPLIRYALAGGLEGAAFYFEQLKRRLIQKLILAVRLRRSMVSGSTS